MAIFSFFNFVKYVFCTSSEINYETTVFEINFEKFPRFNSLSRTSLIIYCCTSIHYIIIYMLIALLS